MIRINSFITGLKDEAKVILYYLSAIMTPITFLYMIGNIFTDLMFTISEVSSYMMIEGSEYRFILSSIIMFVFNVFINSLPFFIFRSLRNVLSSNIDTSLNKSYIDFAVGSYLTIFFGVGILRIFESMISGLIHNKLSGVTFFTSILYSTGTYLLSILYLMIGIYLIKRSGMLNSTIKNTLSK